MKKGICQGGIVVSEKDRAVALLEDIADKIKKWRDLGLSFAEMQEKKSKLLIKKGYSENWRDTFIDQELWAIDFAIQVLRDQA